MNTKTSFIIMTGLLFLSACSNISQAMFAMLPEVPVNRLIDNATAFVQEHPADANGIYVLGRIHYLAFSLKTSLINGGIYEGKKGKENYLPVIEENWKFEYVKNSAARSLALKEFSLSLLSKISKEDRKQYDEVYKKKRMEVDLMDWESIRYIGHKNPKYNLIPDSNQLVLHVSESMKYFRKAIDMSPKNGLYCLGYASLMEQYVNYLKENNNKDFPEEFRDIILEKAKDYYHKAYNFSIDEDLKNIPALGWAIKGLTAYEAGSAFIRLAEQNISISEDELKILPEIKENIQRLDKTLGAITPIIFSLEKKKLPAELLGQNLQVKFDLDGDGAAELWPWVKPSTGILVWNENGKGEITSGRQMFGSVTWWLFFKDGYHALDCLDDNRDGALSGSELAGISVWFDTNSNGKSESGEIKSLEELGIVSISTQSTSTENGWPANKTGIKLRTGQTIPTYDWIAESKL